MYESEVCWTCKGLISSYMSEKFNFRKHVATCTSFSDDPTMNVFKYYVCEKEEYRALRNLKNSLNALKNATEIISRLHDEFPSKIKDVLLYFCPKADHIINKGKTSTNSLTKIGESKDFNDDGFVKSSSHILKSEEEKLKSECKMSLKGKITFFTCKLCLHETKSEKLMLRHLNSHNVGEAFKCLKCDFTTIWRTDWNHHTKKCTDQAKVVCHMCGMDFDRKSKLTKHLSTEHQDGEKLKCNECGFVAKTSACLKDHKQKHTGEMFSCPLPGCDFRSFYQRALTKHLSQKHSQEKAFLCSVCGFRTRHMCSLVKHQLLHKSLKKYKCTACSFVAWTASQVREHARKKHLKQKMFSCPKCPFESSYHMGIKKHVQRHEGLIEFSCSVCGESLPSIKKAKEHLTIGHGCTDQNVRNFINEKTNLKDFEIKNWKELCNEEPSKYVALMTDEEAKSRAAVVKKPKVMDADVNSNDVLELATDILTAEVQTNGTLPSSQALLASSLHTSTSEGNETTNMFVEEAQTAAKDRNPMLSAMSNDLEDDENSLNSLFDLMSDLPPPPNLNRCQSASTLMFTSFSPHLADRPLTPDFFSESPSAGSFFSNFGAKSLVDGEGLSISNLSNLDAMHNFPNANSQSGLAPPMNLSVSKLVNPQSPLLPGFVASPLAGSGNNLNAVININHTLTQEPQPCDNMDSLLSGTVFVNHCPTKGHALTFETQNSAFTDLTGEFSSDDLQAAVASITESTEMAQVSSNAVNESHYTHGPSL